MKKILQFSIPVNQIHFKLVVNESFEYLKIVTIKDKHTLHVLADMSTPLKEKRYVLFFNGVEIIDLSLKYIDSLIYAQEDLLIPLHLFEVLE